MFLSNGATRIFCGVQLGSLPVGGPKIRKLLKSAVALSSA